MDRPNSIPFEAYDILWQALAQIAAGVIPNFTTFARQAMKDSDLSLFRSAINAKSLN